MSYPELPDNRLIVNGIDLTTRFRMVLLDGYTLSPPEPRTYTVEVPGRDGLIDLTESLTGDIPYGNRSMRFTFIVVDLEEFEAVKTSVSNFLHGKAFDFQMTMDPGYTYHGRFKVTTYTHVSTYNHGVCGYFDIEIDCDPYKLKSHMVYNLNATGGEMFQLPSGRKKVHPVIDLKAPARLKFKNVVYRIGAGRFQLNDVLFEEGLNDIYINSYEIQNLTWDEWKQLGPIEIRMTRIPDVQEGDVVFLSSSIFNWDTNLESSKYVLTDYGDYYGITLHVERGRAMDFQVIRRRVVMPVENLLPNQTPTIVDAKSGASNQNQTLTAVPRHIYTSAWGVSGAATDSGYINGKEYATWNEYSTVRWDELQKTDGLVRDIRQKWGDFYNDTWKNMTTKSWKDWNYRVEGAPDSMVTLEYDWKDL